MIVARVSWWVLRRIARYPGEDVVLLTERPVCPGGGYGRFVPRFRLGARGAAMIALGYDLEALERDNPYNTWMHG